MAAGVRGERAAEEEIEAGVREAVAEVALAAFLVTKAIKEAVALEAFLVVIKEAAVALEAFLAIRTKDEDQEEVVAAEDQVMAKVVAAQTPNTVLELLARRRIHFPFVVI